MSNFQDVLARRQQALDTTRDSAGVALKMANPCQHCGVNLFVKETKGVCCKHGKGILPRFAAAPPAYGDVQLFRGLGYQVRKNSRAYNCRSNFASLNVEDGELKKMFGDHLLSVQGR